MSIFDKNLLSIGLKDKALSDRLRSLDKWVETEEAKNREHTFKYGGIYFHSRYDPAKEASVQAEEIASKKTDWVLLFGLGCGYLLKALLEKGQKKVMVFEPSEEILAGVLRNIDLSEELSLDGVFLLTDMVAFISNLRSSAEGFDNLLCFSPTPYRLTFPAELRDFTNRVNNAHTTSKVGIKTDLVSRLDWIENYLENVRHFPETPLVDDLRDRFKGKPMVIVGAGPSLKKNAHLLREFKGKAVIMAAVTAYKPLLKFGVIPDFVIASERVDLPEYFTSGDEDRQTRLILAEVSHPKMFEREVLGKLVYFSPSISFSREHARLWGSSYFPNMGGSVTTAALDMGIMLGCSPIVFIGQDLCFGDNETHVGGGVYVAQNVRIDKEKGLITIEDEYINDKQTYVYDLQWLKGLNGAQVPSKYDWTTFHQWFEAYMLSLRRSGSPVKVINATEGGAYIEGMEHSTLKEVLAGYIRDGLDIDKIVREAKEARTKTDYPALIESFTQMKKSLGVIRKTAQGIFKEVRGARTELKRNGLTLGLKKHADRIKALEEDVFRESENARFIWEALIENTYKLKQYLRDEGETSATGFEKDLDAIEASYKRIDEICQRFGPKLEGAASVLGSRESLTKKAL
ncbi:MAG: motility associated factor glycosyltransferase family protein [Deltaproteobacteria bacterium]|nr:motility associated factor glycosyltransferase family protein [Deltaproteobacteria bacterium]